MESPRLVMFEVTTQQTFLMSEVKKFPGQPVLSQILDEIPSSIINGANRKHKSNRYYKKLPVRVHLVSLLYGVFSYCNGLRELCEGDKEIVFKHDHCNQVAPDELCRVIVFY